jgi:hypothetical protein
MDLYRVFPYESSAAPAQRGGALFVPDPADGRIANPRLYRELYAAGSPHAAIAERFGRYARWRTETFEPRNGPAFALAQLRLCAGARVCDLDDVTMLVTSQRRISQSWARRVFESGRWDGICWWSHYYPAYRVYGIWATNLLTIVQGPRPLTISTPEVEETAREIVRQRDPE